MSYDRFKELTFDKFRHLAQDQSLSRYEKIGFPNAYREGKEEAIFSDIKHKLRNITGTSKNILDIGPGCSDLAFMLVDVCRNNGHNLILVDSAEMLNHLPDESFVTKVVGSYPEDCQWLFERYAHNIDTILTYSVIQYVFTDSNIFNFLDKSLSLLADQGEMLIGDIPNNSMRKRFFASPTGIRHHQNFTGTEEIPMVEFNTLEEGKIDDAVIIAMLSRCRAAGFNAYVLPQPDDLPMANRREDILIQRP